MKTAKRFLAILLPLSLLLCAVAGFSVNAFANDEPSNQVSLSANENIVSHFYLDEAYYASLGGTSLRYSYNNGDTQEKSEIVSDIIPFDDARNSSGDVQINVSQAAAQIAEPITVEILNSSEENVDTITYSAKDYCDDIIDMSSETLATFTTHGAKLQKLCKSIVAYAKSSQGIFTEYMAKEGSVAINDDFSAALEFDSATYDASGYSKTDGPKIGFKTASFMCESSAKMRFYLKVSNEADSTVYPDPEVTAPEGTSMVKGTDGAGSYYIQINDIKPVDFDESITINYAGASITMSVLDYAGKVVSSSATSAALKNLAKSLIRYNENAEAFFSAPATVFVPAAAATCTEPGNEAHYTYQGGTYSDADATISVDPTIPALGHAYNAVVTEPTCTEGGYTTYTCTRCGDTYTGDETSATGHTPAAAVQENVVPATCVDTGSYDSVVYCSVCNTKLSTTPQTIPATGHTPAAAVQEYVVEATCTAAGSYDSVVYCSVCNAEISRDFVQVAALGHNFGDWAVTTPAVAATCTTAGSTAVETRTCSRCSTSENKGGEAVAALGHSWSAWTETTPAVAATCTTAGKTAVQTRTCSRCNTNETQGGATVAALGHSYGAWTVTTGATTSNTGNETRTCANNSSHTESRTVQPFTVKFENTEDYLYRIGNSGTVKLGQLFDNASGANISNVTATVTKVQGNASGSFSPNSSDWRNSTIQFSNTGVVTVTLKHGSTTAATLKLEVVAAKNITSATTISSVATSAVMLNDISTTGAWNISNGTLYGNGFTIDATGTADSSGNTKLGSLSGCINLSSGTLNNVKVIGPNFKNAAVFQTTDTNCVFTVKTAGECYIYNSYIFGSRATIGTYGTTATSNLTVENTVLDGGRYSNIFHRFGKLNLHNVTTINQPRTTLNGDVRCGYGIVISDEATADEQVTATGYLKQYNWVGRTKDVNYFKGDNSSSTSNTAVESLFTNMYSKASSLTVSYNSDTYINTGILSLGSAAPHVTGEAVSGYGSATVSLSNTTGWVMTTTAFDASDAFKYYNATDYSPSTQPPTLPTFTWSYPSEYSSTEKKVGLSYNQGGSVDFTPTGILTAKKYNNSLNVAVSMGGTDYTNKTITFSAPGDYTIVYTVTDPYNYAADGTTTSSRTYTKTLDVTVTEKVSSISDPEFTFYGGNTAGTNLGSKIVDIGGKHYVMPNVSATSDTIKSTTVSGTTVYMPVVTVRFKDNSSDFNYKFPLFYNINIKNYTNASGSSTTYNKSTGGSSLPTPFERITADPNWNGKTSFNSYSKDSTYGLCAVSAAIGSNQSARNATIQFKFTAGNGEEYYYYLYYDAAAHNKPTCVAEGSLITMADGTQKAVEDVKQGDMVMTWSMWNGRYEAQPVAITYYHGKEDWNVLTLNFSDGTDVRMINEHGFFDVDKNTYAYITSSNVDDYIGDRFVKQLPDGSNTEVVLESYSERVENVGSYSLQTAFNENFMVENMLSMTGEDYEGRFEYFDIGEGMKYDEAKMQADIDKYGLYTYEDWSDYLTPEQFYAFNGQYFKVLVGKGVMTHDDIIEIIEGNLN